jgi:hypothetical protein
MTVLANILTHSCTIQRDANAGTADAFGQPNPPSWQNHLASLPCRTQAAAGREAVANTTTVVVIEDVRLVVQSGTDVTEADRVSSVTYRGDEIQAGPLTIRAKLVHQDHIELVLVRAG